MKVNSTPKCIRPEGQVDGGRPALAHMEELLPCTLSEILDGFLGNAILGVGINPTEGESRLFGTAAVLEGVVCKLSVVAVVVEAKCSKAHLASMVSSEVSLVMRWIYLSRE
jgi:hypothetical protein